MSDIVKRLTDWCEFDFPDGDDLNNLLADTVNHIEPLKAELKKACRLLHYCKCPDNNCDGKGTVFLGAHEHESGEYEYEIHPCQWCDEKQKFLCDKALQEHGNE